MVIIDHASVGSLYRGLDFKLGWVNHSYDFCQWLSISFYKLKSVLEIDFNKKLLR